MGAKYRLVLPRLRLRPASELSKSGCVQKPAAQIVSPWRDFAEKRRSSG